jgi:hypothetical protein
VGVTALDCSRKSRILNRRISIRNLPRLQLYSYLLFLPSGPSCLDASQKSTSTTTFGHSAEIIIHIISHTESGNHVNVAIVTHFAHITNIPLLLRCNHRASPQWSLAESESCSAGTKYSKHPRNQRAMAAASLGDGLRQTTRRKDSFK